mmetsp:Transcript_24938/g.69985  ORF Transcript_24938/g.69985 Transcript_24938/m.69985 type:complete len:332 (-) Transcript_24938:343-1338(-)
MPPIIRDCTDVTSFTVLVSMVSSFSVLSSSSSMFSVVSSIFGAFGAFGFINFPYLRKELYVLPDFETGCNDIFFRSSHSSSVMTDGFGLAGSFAALLSSLLLLWMSSASSSLPSYGTVDAAVKLGKASANSSSTVFPEGGLRSSSSSSSSASLNCPSPRTFLRSSLPESNFILPNGTLMSSTPDGVADGTVVGCRCCCDGNDALAAVGFTSAAHDFGLAGVLVAAEGTGMAAAGVGAEADSAFCCDSKNDVPDDGMAVGSGIDSASAVLLSASLDSPSSTNSCSSLPRLSILPMPTFRFGVVRTWLISPEHPSRSKSHNNASTWTSTELKL